MKKKAILISLLGLMIFLAYFGMKGLKKQKLNKQIETSIQVLPDFSFYDLNEEYIQFENISESDLVIIYFHPECEHCQYEAIELFKHRDKFKDAQIIMVSPAPLKEVQEFNISYQLYRSDRIRVFWDQDYTFEDYFGSATFPTVLIYHQNKLQKKYKGEVKIEAILKYLN